MTLSLSISNLIYGLRFAAQVEYLYSVLQLTDNLLVILMVDT